MFFKKKRSISEFDAEIKKIEKLFKENKISFNVVELFKIGEQNYDSQTVLQNAKKAVMNKDFDYLISLDDIDISKDLLQVYLIIDDNKNNMLIGIIDPYELYDNPVIFSKAENIDFDKNLLEHKRIK